MPAINMPNDGSAWIPAPYKEIFEQIRVNSAWVSGDLRELNKIYGTGVSTSAPAGRRGRVRSEPRGQFRKWWNGQPASNDGSAPTRLHSPLAANLASLSADMTFGDEPVVRIVKDGKRSRKTAPELQDALDLMMNSDEARSEYLRGGEYAAGLSAAAFSWAWDRTDPTVDAPWIQTHPADAVIPYFVNGRVSRILIFDHYFDGTVPYLHVVLHEAGGITHGLYAMNANGDRLGKRVPMNGKAGQLFGLDHVPTIKGIRDEGDNVFTVPTGTSHLTAVYMANKPTLTFRQHNQLSRMGRSDFEGAEHYLDAHDEAWSSWLRDVRVARAKLIVSDSMVEGMGAGQGAFYDEYRDIVMSLSNLSLGDEDMKGQVMAQQFDLRWEAHEKTTAATAREVIEHAGWNQSTYSESAGRGDESATGVVDRKQRAERTRDRKLRNARMALKRLSLSGLDIYADNYGGKRYEPSIGDITIDFPEVSQIDPEKQARTFSLYSGVKAVSIETMIRERRPDWDDDEVLNELNRMLTEAKLFNPFEEGVTPPGDDDENEPLDAEGESGRNDAGAFDEA